MAIPFNLPSDECSLEQYRSIHQLLLDLINLLRALLNSEIPPPSPSPNSPIPAYGTYFGFPTPPSSVPSSPSPFSPGAAGTTAFVLPDVVASAMPPNLWNAPTPMMMNSIPVTEPESQMIPEPVRRGSTSGLSNKLRKRKRARLSKKNKKHECADTHCCPSASKCQNSTPCERNREIPKTTGTACSCPCRANTQNVAGAHTDVPEYFIHQSMLRRTIANDNFKSPSWTYIGEELRRMTDGLHNADTQSKDEKIVAEDISEAKGSGLITQCGRTVFAAALLVLGWKLLKQN